MAAHRLTASVIVADADRVLVVCDASEGALRWRLPRADVGAGESLRAAAERGFEEEVGWKVKAGELAFVAEELAAVQGNALHFGFVGRVPAGWASGARSGPRSPKIAEIRFAPTGELRAYLADRPTLIALESWLDERALRYHVFDLDRMRAAGD